MYCCGSIRVEGHTQINHACPVHSSDHDPPRSNMDWIGPAPNASRARTGRASLANFVIHTRTYFPATANF